MIGIDIGSTKIKITDGKKYNIAPITDLNKILIEYSDEEVYATGYFRKNFKNNITEITAAIKGIDKDVDVIIDIGGQDIKIINLKTLEFLMNDKCGAGTGLFLETMSNYLNVPLENFGKCYSKEPLKINNTCSVFAISEVITHLVNGNSIEDIISSLNWAVAKKIVQMNTYEYESIALIGGVSSNESIVKYVKEICGKNVYIPKKQQYINALGAKNYGEMPKNDFF
jgi:predicted CoA-substrate-specific enzyme activase